MIVRSYHDRGLEVAETFNLCKSLRVLVDPFLYERDAFTFKKTLCDTAGLAGVFSEERYQIYPFRNDEKLKRAHKTPENLHLNSGVQARSGSPLNLDYKGESSNLDLLRTSACNQ